MNKLLIILNLFFLNSCNPRVENPIFLVCTGEKHVEYDNSYTHNNTEYKDKETKTYKVINYITSDGKNIEWKILEDGNKEWINGGEEFMTHKVIVNNEFIRFEMNSSVKNTIENESRSMNEVVEINRISGHWLKKSISTNNFYKKEYQTFHRVTEGVCEKVKENKI